MEFSPNDIREMLLSTCYDGLEVAIFVSSPDPAPQWNPAFIDESFHGAVLNLEKAAQTSATPGTVTHQADPYTTELLPVSDLDPIYLADSVQLQQAMFLALDTSKDGGSGQTQATYDALVASLATDRALIQSRYFAGQIAEFQPNGFRPIIKINKSNALYSGLQNAHIQKNHAGHLAYGLPNPWCSKPYLHLPKISELKVYAQMAQEISEGNLLRYPVIAILEFAVRRNKP